MVTDLSVVCPEFCTRRCKGDINKRQECTHLYLAKMSRSHFDGSWTRADFSNDGKPVFWLSRFWLYYRGVKDQWVIDDEIMPAGAVYSRSATGDINSLWTTCQDWVTDRAMSVSKKKNPQGHNAESVVVKGCKTRDLNGTYLR